MQQKKPADIARPSRPTLASSPALAQPQATITLVAAARLHGHSVGALRSGVNSGALRFLERRPHGRGESIIFDRAHLCEDLAKCPSCRAVGCKARALAESGYCGSHFGESGRKAARSKEWELLKRDRDQRSWLTSPEAAERAEVARVTINTACRMGELRAELVGRNWKIDPSGLETWISRRGRRAGDGRRLTAEGLAVRRKQVSVLHAKGLSPAEIAERLGWCLPTIHGDLDALGLPRVHRRAPRTLPSEQRKARSREVARLYVEEQLSLREIAERTGSSATQVGRDLESRGVEMRPKRRPSKYEPAAERPCEQCGRPFTPRSAAEDADKRRRYCSDDCSRAARPAAKNAALRERGLLDAAEAAAYTASSSVDLIHDNVTRGRLRAERVPFAGALKPALGFSKGELDRWLREMARNGDGRQARHLDPHKRLKEPRTQRRIQRVMSEKGVSREDAEQLVNAPVERRARKVNAHNKGRSSAPETSALHARWMESWPVVKAELDRLWEFGPGRELGEPRPSKRTIAGEVARRDALAHPEDWTRYERDPEDPDYFTVDDARRSESRVLMAVRRGRQALQIVCN